jgi:hypothetical protein
MAKMMTVVKGVKVRRGEKIPKAAKGWKLITPGRLGFKASCETQFEHRGGRFAVFRIF